MRERESSLFFVGTINALLHSNLALSWGLQGLGLKRVVDAHDAEIAAADAQLANTHSTVVTSRASSPVLRDATTDARPRVPARPVAEPARSRQRERERDS